MSCLLWLVPQALQGETERHRVRQITRTIMKEIISMNLFTHGSTAAQLHEASRALYAFINTHTHIQCLRRHTVQSGSHSYISISLHVHLLTATRFNPTSGIKLAKLWFCQKCPVSLATLKKSEDRRITAKHPLRLFSPSNQLCRFITACYSHRLSLWGYCRSSKVSDSCSLWLWE